MSKTSRKIVKGKKLMISAKKEVNSEKITSPISGGYNHADQNYCSDHHDTT